MSKLNAYYIYENTYSKHFTDVKLDQNEYRKECLVEFA